MELDNANAQEQATSDSAIPAMLLPERLEAYRQQLEREHQPVGFTESIILRDLAYRAAGMEMLENTVAALHRQGARALAEVTLPLTGSPPFAEDMILAGSVTNSRVDEVFRQGLGNGRAFYRALTELKKLQLERQNAVHISADNDQRFNNEEACQDYLLQRFQSGQTVCRRCGHFGGGCWIASRRSWECPNCKTQVGIRSGTVMEHSPLPLVKWFRAIRMMLMQPTMSAAELGEKVGIHRLPTVRMIRKKILATIASETASALLVGLDSEFRRTLK